MNPDEASSRNFPESEAIRLKDFIAYQEGSVVSRELVSKKTGTVTLFAFDRAQGLSEHTAPFDALIFCVEGKAKVFISGKPVPLNEGEMLLMPAHKPHSLKAEEKFKMLLIMIRAEKKI